MKKHFLLGSIVFAACFLFLFSGTASAKLDVFFTDKTVVHLDYEFTADNEDETLLELVQGGSGGEVILASQGGNPPGTIKGKKRLSLNEGSLYTFFWRVTVETETETTEYQYNTVPLFTLMGPAQGKLLFDETFTPEDDEAYKIGSVTVPDSITLSLEKGEYESEGTGITVKGTISISESAKAPDVPIYFYASHSFTGLTNMKLVFAKGSEGSEVKGNGVDADPNAKDDNLFVTLGTDDIIVRDVDGLSLAVPGGASNRYVESCRIDGSLSLTDFESSDSVRFTDVEYNPESVLMSGGSWSLQSTSATFDFSRCRILKGLSIGAEYSVPWFASFSECIFENGISVYGGAPTFEDCEFHKTILLYNRTAAEFTDNVFVGSVYFFNADGVFAEAETPRWEESGTPSPTFTGNSFVGRSAFSYDSTEIDTSKNGFTPVAIGKNYYGSKKGYQTSPPAPDDTTNQFLGHHGASIELNGSSNPKAKNFFDPKGYTSSGKFAKDEAVLPEFWTWGWITGQNTLTHGISFSGNGPMIRGKDTAICVDVGTSAESATGMEVSLTFNGKDYEPEGSNKFGIKRDIGGYGNTQRIVYGGASFDFIIPGSDTDVASGDWEFTVDTTNLDGYGKAPDADRGKTVIAQGTLKFTEPPAKKLVIDVIPAWLILKGMGSTTTFVPIMNGIGTSMLPLKSTNFDIKVRPSMWGSPLASYAGDTAFAVWFFDWAVRVKAAYAVQKTAGALGLEERVPHMMLVLLPENTLSTKAGGYIQLGNVIFVDEKDPMAFYHEMGHYIGLYLDPEQYDEDPKYPFGYFLEGCTAFNTDNMTYGTGFSSKYRILHFPDPKDEWYAQQDWRDIMGSLNPSWMRTSTLGSFNVWINSNLRSSPRTSDETRKDIKYGPPEPGYRRIMLSCNAKYEEDVFRNIPVSGTMKVMDLTPLAQEKEWIGSTCYFNLFAYDASGNVIDTDCFQIADPEADDPVAPDGTFYWSATFDIPEQTARLKVFTQWDWDSRTFLDITTNNDLNVGITSPASGQTLDGDTRVAWQATGGRTARSSDTSPPNQYIIMYSNDGGVTWEIGDIVESTDLTMDPEFLSPANNVSIKIIATDGLRTAQAQVDNLIVPEREPEVVISMPQQSDSGSTADTWTLSGLAVNGAGKDISASGSWSSSLDGALGNGGSVTDVSLSAGSHTIAFTAVDNGLTGSASVYITVGATDAPDGVDLTLEEDALTLQAKSYYVPGTMTAGAVHNVSLNVRCPDTSASGTLKLYYTPPSGAEELLSSTDFDLNRGETATAAASFTASAAGTYTFRGVVEDVDPADSNTANNSRNWSFSTQGGSETYDPSGWWYVPSEPGWGLSMEQRDDTVFLVWYAYDATGTAAWYACWAEKQSDNTYAGTLRAFTGWELGQAWTTPQQTPNGTVTLTLGQDTATLEYASGTDTQLKTLKPYLPDLASGVPDSRGIDGWWWNDQFPGMGWYFGSRGDTLFVGWYNYRQNSSSRWWVLGGWEDVGGFPQGSATYTGSFKEYQGGPTLTGSYTTASEAAGQGGAATLTFTGSGEDLSISVDFAGTSYTLERYTFSGDPYEE